MEEHPATFSPRKNKSKRFCCVPQCTSKASREITVRFHQFPKDGEIVVIENNWGLKENCDRRRLWIHKLRIGKPVSKNMVVCSMHFQRSDYILPDFRTNQRNLKKNAVPSLNLPKSACSRSILTERRPCRKLLEHREKQPIPESDTEIAEESEMVSESLENAEQEAASALISLAAEIPLAEKHSVEVQAMPLTRDFGCQVSSGDFTTNFTDFVENSRTLTTFTGIDTFLKLSCLITYFSLIQPESNRYTLRNKEKVIMTLMKLKLNWSFRVLGVIFGCTATTCKNVFVSSLTVLASILKKQLVFPSKESILRRMPLCFKNYVGVRIVLDCTEIKLSKYKCLSCRIMSYSYYKGSNTVKYLIGVTLGGLISFISTAYGGRASDKKIFEESKSLDLLDEGDSVMVDRGFLIKSVCEGKNIKVIQPPFSRNGRQFTKAEALETAEIAKARVHVERAIERVKKFKILQDTVTHNVTHVIDLIMIVVCALTNLSQPILAEDKFM